MARYGRVFGGDRPGTMDFQGGRNRGYGAAHRYGAGYEDFRGGFQGSRGGRGQRGYGAYNPRGLTANRGNFSREFGGGGNYAYEGMDSDQWSRRLRAGWQQGYGRDFRSAGRGAERSGNRGASEGRYGRDYGGGRRYYGGSAREEDRISYGPNYGERWESIQPEDVAQRNFDQR